jgi:hypothetical protein
MINTDYEFDFYGARINAQSEYLASRKLMLDPATDLRELSGRIFQLRVHIDDEKWGVFYDALFDECKRRNELMSMVTTCKPT